MADGRGESPFAEDIVEDATSPDAQRGDANSSAFESLLGRIESSLDAMGGGEGTSSISRGIKRRGIYEEKDGEASPPPDLKLLGVSIVKELMDFTMGLWAQKTGRNALWMENGAFESFRDHVGNIPMQELSGLALLFYGPRVRIASSFELTKPIARLYISFVVHCITAIFRTVREKKLQRWDARSGVYVFGRDEDLPRYLSKELVLKYVSNETDFNQKLVGKLFCFPTRPIGVTVAEPDQRRSAVEARGYEGTGATLNAMIGDVKIAEEDIADMVRRRVATECINKTVRQVLNMGRKMARKYLYIRSLFLVRKIAHLRSEGFDPAEEGFYIDWNPVDHWPPGGNRCTIEDMDPWCIPLASTRDDEEGRLYNEKAFQEMEMHFPEMKCTIHFRVNVRAPSAAERPDLSSLYEKELEESGQRFLYTERWSVIDFHIIAAELWKCLMKDGMETPTSQVLQASIYSLRSIHIIALGLRGLVGKSTGRITSKWEDFASAGTSAEEVQSVPNYGGIAMMGARVFLQEGAEFQNTGEMCDVIDAKLTTQSYEFYLAGKEAPEETMSPFQESDGDGEGTRASQEK